MVCGTLGRPCPKIDNGQSQLKEVGPYQLPPPCVYVLPSTIPSARNNPSPPAQKLKNVELLQAFHDCFGGKEEDINFVAFEVVHEGAETMRKTIISRAGEIERASDATAIRRS
jgi:hypothetical protein